MTTISDGEMLNTLEDGNRFMGTVPEMTESKVVFNGKNNILICESGVKLVKSTITFNGNNAVVYLCESRNDYYLSLNMNHNNVFYMGRNNYMNGTLNITLSEQKHCLIGDDCLLSFGIWMRTADPHLVFRSSDQKRVNLSKSIYIGDHVWIGQSAYILKGTRIDSGSIIGAMSLVAGKKIPHNESWAGNPCKQIAEGVFWDGSCVHRWTEKQTELSMDFDKFAKKKNLQPHLYEYEYVENETVSYDMLEQIFSGKNTEEKIQFLDKLSSDTVKNRFVHQYDTGKRRWFGKK